MTERLRRARRAGPWLAMCAALAFSVAADARPRRRGRRGRVKAARVAKCPRGWVRARVADATQGFVFVGRGTEDGLERGAELRFRRGRRRLGRCEVELASGHHARCAFEGARAGDVACYAPARPGEAPQVEPRAVGPDVAARPPETAQMRSALAASGVPEVVDEAAPVTDVLSLRADAALAHGSFVRDGGAFHRQSLRVWVRDVPLGFLDTTASLDLSVLTYAARPEDARFRTGARAMLYVHETAIERRARDGRLVLGLGRIRPWHAPGVPYLDGAQVGFRVTEAFEVGVLGGGLPDLVRLEPSPKRWLAGAYGGGHVAWDRLRLDVSGRVGMVRAPEIGNRGELEARARLGYGRGWSVAGGARMRADGDGVGLSSARARVDLSPAEGWHLALDGRLRDDAPDPYAASVPIVAADHARASVRWRPSSSLSLGLAGGVGYVRADDLLRGVVGPEVGLPSLFGALGGLFVGYQEALGDLPGRTGWVQARLQPTAELALWTRLAYREDRLEAGPLRELGAFLQADWRFARFLRARASLFGRLGLTDRGAALPGGGLVARASLVASY